MTFRQPHPEDLLDLEMRGLLSEADREQLDDHLRVCAACSAQVWAHAAVAHDRQSDRLDFDLDHTAVDRALAALGTGSFRRTTHRRSWAWAPAAALPLTALAALAGWLTTRRAPEPVAVVTSMNAPTASVRAGDEADASPPDAPPSAAPPSAAQPLPAPGPPSSAHGAQPGPAELFRRAGDLKRRGDGNRAVEVYGDLQQRFPNSPEAKLSFAVAGQLLLDQRKYGISLAQFNRYLATPGPAREEALVGRAMCLQGLGQKTEEVEAWQALLNQFPDSVYARPARSRLIGLGARADGPDHL